MDSILPIQVSGASSFLNHIAILDALLREEQKVEELLNTLKSSYGVEIGRSTLNTILNNLTRQGITEAYRQEGRTYLYKLSEQRVSGILKILGAYNRPSSREVKEAVRRGINWLLERYCNICMGSPHGWPPYFNAVHEHGALATSDALTALVYPALRFGFAPKEVYRDQKGNDLTGRVCEVVNEAAQSLEYWRANNGGIKPGGDLPGLGNSGATDATADLIMTFTALERFAEVAGCSRNELDLAGVKELAEWLLGMQNSEGYWKFSLVPGVKYDRGLVIPTALCINALSLYIMVNPKWEKREEALNSLKRGTEALMRVNQDGGLGFEPHGESKLSATAHALLALLRTLEMRERIAEGEGGEDFIRWLGEKTKEMESSLEKLLHFLLNNYYRIFRDPTRTSTESFVIAGYEATYPVLGVMLHAFAKSLELGYRLDTETRDRLEAAAHILASACSGVLGELGYMFELRGQSMYPATSATASMIIGLVEYDWAVNGWW